MCLSEYLLFKYKENPVALVSAPQGQCCYCLAAISLNYSINRRINFVCSLNKTFSFLGDSEELAKAQRLYDEATAALDDVLSRLEAQKEAARKSAEAEKAAQVGVAQ
tara:strand:- start:784 stop:1104 length:321 start_codon:yes stop_codon:yes gene_type:complete